jgi:asparagine synthase (glutamine-hydrolysing)
MCGIAGILDNRLPDEQFKPLLDRMGEAQRHRGPDENGSIFDADVRAGLHCSRLSIVDLVTGSQPISNEDRSIHVVLNGEIYNHRELRQGLEERGHRFRTNADTEVIVHLYEEKGTDALAELNGMFGLAILDVPKRKLLLARDRAGMKPLHYAETLAGLVFGSEIKAVLASGLIPKEPDWKALDAFLAVGYVPAPQTCFAKVRSVPQGSYLVADGKGIRVEPFWRMRFDNSHPVKSEGEYSEELEAHLESAVRSHLRADVTVGAMVSGGWDSSVVAALAARNVSGRLKTFSLMLPDSPDIDESMYQRAVSKHLDSEHHEIEFRAEDIPRLVSKGIRHLEQPFEGPALLDFQIASLTSEHVKVALSGQGADELLAGYPWTVIDPFNRLRRVFPKPLARMMEPAFPHPYGRMLRMIGAPDEAQSDIEFFRIFTRSEIDSVFSPDLPLGHDDSSIFRVDPDVIATCADRLQRRLSYDYTLLMPSIILNYHDKMSMAHSIEVRMPFLDRGMIDLAFRMPSSVKLRDGQPKYILGSLADRLLPPEVARREKRCLQYPMNQYLNGPLKKFTLEFLLDSNGSNGLFVRPNLEKALSKWLTPKDPHLRRPWSLIGLQAWWNEFFAQSVV